jgi:hypothetical protein
VAFYQCFKTKDRDVYCSSTEFKNHDEGNVWVAACMKHFAIRADQMLGKPYESDDQPARAKIWP